MDFSIDYVRCGFSAGSLSKRTTELRHYAARLRVAFPALDSDDWRLVTRVHRALAKFDPIELRQATPMSMFWIVKTMKSMGIESARDLRVCIGSTCCAVARLLLSHCAMLRACEHDLQVQDLLSLSASHGVVLVNRRKKTRKIKLRPPRTVVVPSGCEGGVLSAGAALRIFYERFHAGKSALTDPLFPRFEGVGDATMIRGSYELPGVFMKKMRRHAARAGMSTACIERLTCHSLRSGGATDWMASGMQKSSVQRQGGWSSDTILVYVRPQSHHRWMEAQGMMRCMARMVQLPAVGAGGSGTRV